MYFYGSYVKIKSIDDLSIGDLLLFSHDKSNLPSSLTRRRLNSEWVVISKVEDKKITIRNKRGKQLITLSSGKLKDGFIKIEMENKSTLTFMLFYKKRYELFEYLKVKFLRLLKWIFID